jgi:hypothetical protein
LWAVFFQAKSEHIFSLSNLRAIPPLPRVKEDVAALPALEAMGEAVRQVPVAVLGMLQDEAQPFLLLGLDGHGRPYLGFHFDASIP